MRQLLITSWQMTDSFTPWFRPIVFMIQLPFLVIGHISCLLMFKDGEPPDFFGLRRELDDIQNLIDKLPHD